MAASATDLASERLRAGDVEVLEADHPTEGGQVVGVVVGDMGALPGDAGVEFGEPGTGFGAAC